DPIFSPIFNTTLHQARILLPNLDSRPVHFLAGCITKEYVKSPQLLHFSLDLHHSGILGLHAALLDYGTSSTGRIAITMERNCRLRKPLPQPVDTSGTPVPRSETLKQDWIHLFSFASECTYHHFLIHTSQ
ncbi:hypothetical protein PENTCL1PPCAC_8837, partial [Pristionchus entomophagus]